jgi:hypothetical protein
MYSLVLTGVDRRMKACVIMAATPRFPDWFMLNNPHPPQAYADALARVDPITYAPYAAPAALFFQFGEADRYVSKERAEEFFDAASVPKQIGYYGGFHELDDEARQARLAWLAEQLDLEEES